MSPHSTFLPCVLRLQICDRDFRGRRPFSARAFRPAGKCRGLFEFLAFRRLQIPARDLEGGGCGHDNPPAGREHTAVVRAPPRRITRAVAVERLCQTPGCLPWRFTETPYNFQYAARCAKSSRPIEATVPTEF